MSSFTEEDFIAAVKQAEQDAQTKPKAYLFKLTFFALLGYAVIFLSLFTLLGLAGSLLATIFFSSALFIILLKTKLIFVTLPAIWILLRALWVKFTPPEGYKLKRKDYPILFGELDTLSKQLKALKIHEVIIDRELNAAVIQHPRLGILGWQKNYLILGYQLLLVLSPEEMRSVLAHEFGHLSKNHSRFSAWIYRVRLTWMRIMASFEDADSWGTRLMRKFFNWYSPKFEAYSFALARNNEYEADAVAAELTSAETASRALVNVHATAPYIEKSYWDSYFQLADSESEPPHPPFEGLITFLGSNPLSRVQMLESIKTEMSQETHYADTHPSLKDRIEALNAEPQLPISPKNSAASEWLGEKNQEILKNFDSHWINENGDSWKQRYEYVCNAKQKLLEFSNKKPSELTDNELWDYAYYANEFESKETSLPLFKAYQERFPEDPDPAFFIGMTLLEQGEASGLNQLRIAIKSPHLIEQAATEGYNFLKNQGKDDEAKAWWNESIRENQIHQTARKERDNLDTKDRFKSPNISDELLEQLITNLKAQNRVSKVWLAEKELQHYPEHPVYIIAFKAKGFSFSTNRLQTKIAEELNIDAAFFVVCKSGDAKSLAKKVIKTGRRIV